MVTLAGCMQAFEKTLNTYWQKMSAARDEQKKLAADFATASAAFADRSRLRQVDATWWTDGKTRFKEPSVLQQEMGENKKRQEAIVGEFTAAQFAIRQKALGTTSAVNPRDAAGTVRIDTMVNKVIDQNYMYAWGGGGPKGPSLGVSDNGGDADLFGDQNIVGFDCSGLAAFLLQQTEGTTIGITSEAQYAQGTPVEGDPQPGDLVFPAGSFENGAPKHVQYYLGNGMVMEAPESGKPIQIVPVAPDSQFRTPGAVDPQDWGVRRTHPDPGMITPPPNPFDPMNVIQFGEYGQSTPYDGPPKPVE